MMILNSKSLIGQKQCRNRCFINKLEILCLTQVNAFTSKGQRLRQMIQISSGRGMMGFTVFSQVAQTIIYLKTSTLNLLFHQTSVDIMQNHFMPGCLFTREFWDTAERKEGWKGVEIHDSQQPGSFTVWKQTPHHSTRGSPMCIMELNNVFRFTVNKTFGGLVWRCTNMLADLMCARVILRGQSDLFIVQWALSLAEGEHSLAQQPPPPFLFGPHPVQPWG